MIGHLVAALVMQRLPVQNGRLRYLTRSLEQEKYKPLGHAGMVVSARAKRAQFPLAPFARPTREDCRPATTSAGVGLFRGPILPVSAICFLTACSRALNAESTAAVVCRDKSPTSSAGSDAVFFSAPGSVALGGDWGGSGSSVAGCSGGTMEISTRCGAD